jgi:hypothetical protein
MEKEHPMRGLVMAALMMAGTAQADVVVEFRDGAPKDRFTITNTGGCSLSPVSVRIDLSTAPVGLIFDVTAQGRGVEVFQPFEVVQGAELIEAATVVEDGDQAVQLDLSGLESAQVVAFTIDLDDTGGGREITVSGSEIAGARVLVATDDELSEMEFDASGLAQVALVGCVS